MPMSLTEFEPLLGLLLPPLLGAFIGYLTNRIAIRMLFRPLRQWRIGPFRVPLTPGVIPSKRHQLAENIGAMVGEQLLTSDEINKALQREAFQEHLAVLIEAKVGGWFKRDLGALPSLIPAAYRTYFDIGRKTVSYQIKDTVQLFLRSDRCAVLLEQALSSWSERLLQQPVEALVDADQRRVVYRTMEQAIGQLLTGPALARWIDDHIRTHAVELAEQGKTLGDVVPTDLQVFIIEVIRQQTPHLLDRLGDLLAEEPVRERLIASLVKTISDFIGRLGPMAGMIRSFVKMEQVEEKIRNYLEENQDDLIDLLHRDEFKDRLTEALGDSCTHLFARELREIFDYCGRERVMNGCSQVAEAVSTLFANPATIRTVSSLFEDLVEERLDGGRRQTGRLLEDLWGTSGGDQVRQRLQDTVIEAFRSSRNRHVVDGMIDTLLDDLLSKPIGRLDHLIPAGVRDGLYRSIREMATAMLVSEVPGVVKSIDISRIVSTKIDSFDLLQVERLLLSIMQEQFKYINLFGAVLGFIIGCANLLVLLR